LLLTTPQDHDSGGKFGSHHYGDILSTSTEPPVVSAVDFLVLAEVFLV
jgi:hypothetical protein